MRSVDPKSSGSDAPPTLGSGAWLAPTCVPVRRTRNQHCMSQLLTNGVKSPWKIALPSLPWEITEMILTESMEAVGLGNSST